jgi:hypothetical protein
MFEIHLGTVLMGIIYAMLGCYLLGFIFSLLNINVSISPLLNISVSISLVGFIFGLLGGVALFIPVAGDWLAKLGAFLAIILCGFALVKSMRDKQPIDGSAIAGIALGIAVFRP